METIRTWLQETQAYKRQYGLKRMQALLEQLENPQERLTCIHVTGTNGKGSTIAMLSALFKEHGYCVGAFVSPHLIDVTDRFLLNGIPMSESDFEQVGSIVRQACQVIQEEWGHVSFFEAITAIAFVYFEQKNVDMALIEVGIGGLLDTTNVIVSDVSVITSIGMDHQEMLGETEEAITIQKTGIIKQGQPVILGRVSNQARYVAALVADAYGSTLLCQGKAFDLFKEETCYRFQNHHVQIEIPRIGLEGTYQVDNAAVALETFMAFMELKGWKWSTHQIQKAMSKVRWAGRMEIMQQHPLIILDGAHNVHAMTRFVETVKGHQDGGHQTILFSALKRKDYHQMLAYLHSELPEATIIVTTFDFPGAIEASDVPSEQFLSDAEGVVKRFRQTNRDSEQLWITGSLYFLSEIRKNF